MEKHKEKIVGESSRTPSSEITVGESSRRPSSEITVGESSRTPSSEITVGESSRTPSSEITVGESSRTPSSEITVGESSRTLSSSGCIEELPYCNSLPDESSNSDYVKLETSDFNKPEQPSCSKDTYAVTSRTTKPLDVSKDTSSCSSNTSKSLDAKIKAKINDLNQTFLRIINNLKIMNVHNRNSGRCEFNSNNQILNLFDDFLNISHLLNIKINYLYNTYMSRSEMKKYISSINYKLYVFNINSFELSQGIDKENKKHKKYQILHDLNISEMTNNVKLFNFVDDVAVNPVSKASTSSTSEQHNPVHGGPCTSTSYEEKIVFHDKTSEANMKQKTNESSNVLEPTIPILSDLTSSPEPTHSVPTDSISSQSPDPTSVHNNTNENNDHHATDKHFTKRLKRKPETCEEFSEDNDHVVRSLEVTNTAADNNTKKLKTMELNSPRSPTIEFNKEYNSESVDMFNNLFKEINSNILELSKDIDVLNSYLKLLTSKSQSNEEDSEELASSDDDDDDDDEEMEELKKQTLADQRLKKWQITQMTRSLIDNMVNSIQEEMMSRRNERHERSLVNEAVLMAIQRHGLQREQRAARERYNERESERDNSPPRQCELNELDRIPSAHVRQRLNSSGGSSCADTPLESAGTTSKGELKFTDKEQRFSMAFTNRVSTSGPASSLPNKHLSDQSLPSLMNTTDPNKVQSYLQHQSLSDPDELESGHQDGIGSQNVGTGSQNVRIGSQNVETSSENVRISSENVGGDSHNIGSRSQNLVTGSQKDSHNELLQSGSSQLVQSVGEEQGPFSCSNDNYYETMSSETLSDDFLTQAVSVAISKKGLST